MYKKPPYQEGGNIQEKVVMMTILIEGHIEMEDPPREGDIQIKVEGHLTGADTLIEDLLGEDIQIEMEDPQKRRISRGGPPDGNEGPSDGGGPHDGVKVQNMKVQNDWSYVNSLKTQILPL